MIWQQLLQVATKLQNLKLGASGNSTEVLRARSFDAAQLMCLGLPAATRS